MKANNHFIQVTVIAAVHHFKHVAEKKTIQNLHLQVLTCLSQCKSTLYRKLTFMGHEMHENKSEKHLLILFISPDEQLEHKL